MGLLIFSFALFIFGLPLGEFSRISPTITTSFTLIDLLVVPISFLWLLRQLFLRRRLRSIQAKSFLAVILVFILSLFVNMSHLSLQQSLTAGLYIVRFFCYGSLFFIYWNANKNQQQKIQIILFISGLLLLTGGYVQYFFYPSLKNLVYFGWDEHFYRMFGTFFDPNFFGLFLSLFFIYLSWICIALWKNGKKSLLLGIGVVALATFVGILLTYSRTALIGLVIGLFILFWKKEYKRLLLGGFLILLCIVLGFFAISNRKTDMNSLFRKTSTDARFGSARNALTIFLDDPVFGIGFNAYRYAQYRHKFMLGNPVQEDHGASGADNSLLLVLATSGIIGITTFCVFLWSHIKNLVNKKDRLGIATLTAFLIGSFFVNGLFYPLLLVWVWVILGITESNEQ